MNPKRAISYFGTQTALASALNITQPAVSNWFKRGAIPPLQQLAIQNLTGSALRADASVLRKVSHK